MLAVCVDGTVYGIPSAVVFGGGQRAGDAVEARQFLVVCIAKR